MPLTPGGKPRKTVTTFFKENTITAKKTVRYFASLEIKTVGTH
jgi:hypothetical protein